MIIDFRCVDRSCYLVLFGRKKKGEAPTGPMVRPGKKWKASVDDTPNNKMALVES